MSTISSPNYNDDGYPALTPAQIAQLHELTNEAFADPLSFRLSLIHDFSWWWRAVAHNLEARPIPRMSDALRIRLIIAAGTYPPEELQLLFIAAGLSKGMSRRITDMVGNIVGITATES